MDSTTSLATKIKCPQCRRQPGSWYERAANGSRELFWIGCKVCGHLMGGTTQGNALQSWDRFVVRWIFEHAVKP